MSTDPGLDLLAGRRVVLRQISVRDYEALRMLEGSGQLGPRWRLRGETPSPEVHSSGLWAGVLAQFLVVGRDQDSPVGVVCAYNTDQTQGYVFLAAAAFEPESTGLPFLEGLILFIEYLFVVWPFRKIYIESAGFNTSQFASAATTLFVVEGELRQHEYFDGRYWDKVIWALYRDEWESKGRRFVRLARGVRKSG